MSKTYYVTTETRQQLRTLLAMIGDDQTVNFDASSWASDNSDVTTATWSVESGQASIDGESLSANVATARITTSQSGKSMIKLILTDGTNTKVEFLSVHAKDPHQALPTSDYGLVRG